MDVNSFRVNSPPNRIPSFLIDSPQIDTPPSCVFAFVPGRCTPFLSPSEKRGDFLLVFRRGTERSLGKVDIRGDVAVRSTHWHSRLVELFTRSLISKLRAKKRLNEDCFSSIKKWRRTLCFGCYFKFHVNASMQIFFSISLQNNFFEMDRKATIRGSLHSANYLRSISRLTEQRDRSLNLALAQPNRRQTVYKS